MSTMPDRLRPITIEIPLTWTAEQALAVWECSTRCARKSGPVTAANCNNCWPRSGAIQLSMIVRRVLLRGDGGDCAADEGEEVSERSQTTKRKADIPTEALIMGLRVNAASRWPRDIKRQNEWMDEQLKIVLGERRKRSYKRRTHGETQS
jgi:hypothetical protein